MKKSLLFIYQDKKLLFLLAICSFFLSFSVNNIFFNQHLTPYNSSEKITWLSNKEPGNAAYFRKKLFLPAEIKNAWVSIGAKDSFELIVNGNTASRFFYWRPTRPFQNGLSENGQKIGKSRPALGLNYPREYQWSSHKSYKLPTFIDISPFLKKGHNIIALKIESRTFNPAFFIDGGIELTTRQKIALSGAWTSTSLPKKQKNNHWSELEFNSSAWENAVSILEKNSGTYQNFNPEIFSDSFNGALISSSQNFNSSDGTWFNKKWHLNTKPKDAWIRIYANRHFSAFINGVPLKTSSLKLSGTDSGEWIAQSNRAKDLPQEPELLDPDEIGEFFSGGKFANTPRSDPTLNNFKAAQNTQNKTKDRPFNSIKESENKNAANRGADAFNFSPYSYRPERRTPKSLTKKLNQEKFYLYSVKNLLKKGENKISIRLNNPSSTFKGKIAVDGKAYFKNSKSSILKTDSSWKFQNQLASGIKEEKFRVSSLSKSGLRLPKKEYRGEVTSFSQKFINLIFITLSCFCFYFLLSLLLLKSSANIKKTKSALTHAVYLKIICFSSFFLLRSSYLERHESIYFLIPSTWIFIVLISFILFFITYWRMTSARNKLSKILNKSLSHLKNYNFWPFLVFSSLAVCFFLRAFKLDFQPLDDDEYSSTQAILAISQTGLPKFNEDIWYTRSPLYHYLIGLIVRVFGENLWSLRLPSVIFGTLTAFLVYLIGKELLKSKAIGFTAMALYILHPFTIYSSHIARFYQQQQFFFLLTVYLFIKGFVTVRNQTLAYAAILSFLCSVLSQEISLILGLQLAVAYIIFAKKFSIKNELRLFTLAISVILLIAINLIIFQTKCLTRLDGVSPNLEATLALNFSSPMNFFSLFIAYSRLHIPLSIFFFLGIPFCLRKNNINILILYYFTLSGVLLTNILVTGVSLRYQYSLIPFWLLLSVYGCWSLVELAGEKILENSGPNRHKWFIPLCFSLFYCLFILSFSPWRIVGSYNEKILGDSTGALSFVRSQLREGDKVAITEPHPHAAKIELGKVDYDLAIPLLYDFAYTKNGTLIDRNGGAKIISSVSGLQEAISKHPRLWVLVNREKFRSRGKNIRWEYPGARAELFLRENLKVVHETYLWTVFLWDESEGQYRAFNKNKM